MANDGGDRATARPGRGIGDDLVGNLISAAIFGYFGFASSWVHERTLDGELLWAIVLLKWTLRLCALGFLVAAGLGAVNRVAGAALSAILALLSALVFAVVAAWDLMHPDLFSGVHPVVLLLLACWNAWTANASIRDLRGRAPVERGA